MFWPFVICLTGISTLAKSPTQASDYLQPLLSFAAAHVPKNKHKETPLYILCTAGMRLLSERCTDVAFFTMYFLMMCNMPVSQVVCPLSCIYVVNSRPFWKT